MSEAEFKDKVAIVTGGAMGIGEAIAVLLAERGAKVAILDRDAETAEKVAAGLAARGLTAKSFPTDVAAGSEVAASVAAVIRAFGGIDIVSNNAGIQRYGTVEETDEELWDEVLSVNTTSMYLTAKYAIPEMRKRGGGAIVNIGSVQGLATQTQVAAYSTSNGASRRTASRVAHPSAARLWALPL